MPMADDFYSAERVIEPFDSRVSNPMPQLDSKRPVECRELDDANSLAGNLSQQQVAECEQHNAESPLYRREEVTEDRSFIGRELARTEEGVVNLLLSKRGEESDQNGEMNQYKPERCVLKSPDTGMENSATRAFMTQRVAKTEEFDDKVFLPNAEANGEKSGYQGQQMAKREENYCSFPQLTEDKNEKKEDSISQPMSKSDGCDAECPKYAREYIDMNCNSFYPQIVEVKYQGDSPPTNVGMESDQKIDSNACRQMQGKYFYYDRPVYEDTGYWIPVSIPPMSESEHDEWSRGFCSNGGYIPEGDMGWDQLVGEDKELTMWDVVVEMLLAARGKVNALASGDVQMISWISSHLIEQAWKEMAQTLTEANFGNTQEILEAEPPKWLPDSAASACMLCSVRFHPIMCTRHHCRFCGGIFCGECTKGRSLLPEKFRTGDPQRVCDVCCVRLESIQPYLMNQVSRAAQLPTHDLTDLSTLRSWVNFPWGQSMEYEIYKAANTLRGYTKVGYLKPEKKIPEAILRHAKGLAILTVVKVGMAVTYNIGTGLVVARREDGTWSPPSAISSFGVGWGAQAGGELTDFMIVLRTTDAVKTFSSDTHLSIGAGLSAAFGIIGRAAEADVRAGAGGCAACYTYSCSKGAFIGCSVEGSFVTTRARENCRFYGSQLITASDILLGSLPRPPAAAILYRALQDLYQKL